MTTNAIISEMFEEIKDSIKILEDKISGIAKPDLKIEKETHRKREQNRQAIEGVLQQISQHLLEINRGSISMKGQIQDSEERIINAITAHKMKQNHLNKIQLKKKSIFRTFVVLLLLFIGAFMMNVYQFKKIKEIEENARKYQFIILNGGISEDQLIRLDSLFLNKGE